MSVLDHGFLYGDGVYDTLRTYGGKIWNPGRHLERLENSAKLLGIKMFCGRREMIALMEKLVKKNGYAESRIRVTVTRGANGFVFGDCKKSTLLIQAAPLMVEPRGVYARGVFVISFMMERPVPEAKSLSLLPMVMARREAEKKKAFEAVFVDGKGFVREGSISSVFIVKGRDLITPKNKALKGITRETVLHLAKKAGLRAKETDFRLKDLYGADEVFITNTTRKIVPVKKVDGKKIGKSCPGKFTKSLMEIFDGYIQKNR